MTAARARKKAPVQEQLALELPEGVHLNLPEALYFDAQALGSSDFHILDKDPASWWYASSFNPERREQRRKSRALAFGSALHALILEGEPAYARRFVVEPDGASSKWARGRDAILTRLEQVGFKNIPRGKDSFDMAKLHQAARAAGIDHQVWDLMNADYARAKQQGKDYITADEDRRLRRMAHQVAQHPDLGPNLKKGLSEVSVFWRRADRPQILLRARFDKLLPNFTIDLKTFSNPRDESPEEAALNAITNQGYDLQAEHYREARGEIPKFIKAGKVYVWSQEDGEAFRAPPVQREKDLLAEIAAAEVWLWAWIFYQVQNDDAGREQAPIVVPFYAEPKYLAIEDHLIPAADRTWALQNREFFTNARATIERALDNYAAWVERSGLQQPWAEVRAIRPLPFDRLKRLAFKRTAQ